MTNELEMLEQSTTDEESPENKKEAGEEINDRTNTYREVDELFVGMEREERLKLQQTIYDNYATAIRLREREPLERGRFYAHFYGDDNLEESIAFGCNRNGYLLGSEIENVFVPTHFAPANLKGGYRLIKGLLEEDQPTALFITQDLVDTIEKMDGWKVLPFKIHANFRGEIVEKTLVINKWGVLPHLALYQAKRSIRKGISEARSIFYETQDKLKEFGEKIKHTIQKDNANADDLSEEVRATLYKGLDWFEDDNY